MPFVGSAQIITTADLDVDCGANNTIELQQNVYGLQFVPSGSMRLDGGSPPTATAYKSGYILEFPTGSDATAYCNFSMLPQYDEGQNVDIYVCWAVPVAGAGGGAENVKWDVSYSWCDVGSAFAAASTATITADVQADAIDTLREDVLAAMAGAGMAIRSTLICSVTRDTTVADNYGSSAYLVGVGIRPPINVIGSRQKTAK